MNPIIGTVFQTGRIDFQRAENAWVFEMIDRGLKDNQRDRIRFDPAQAPIELQSAPINEDGEPGWMASIERQLQTSNSIYLQYRKGILRFRLALHDAGSGREFVTLGTQDEVNLYASEHWTNLRYFYAMRRDAFQFDINTMISHKKEAEQEPETVEITGRVDYQSDPDKPAVVFDSTGSSAAVEIVEWRSTVREGTVGRFNPKNTRISFGIKSATHPITLLHEDRTEFGNHSYTFNGTKMWDSLHRLIARRLKDRAVPND